MPPTVGVDFGTATTLVATRPGWGPATVLPIGRANPWLPSVARLTPHGLVVGEAAEDAGPDQIRSVKRAITERRDSVTVDDADGPQEVPADAVVIAILAELVARARHLRRGEEEPATVRLGCPAMWDGAQRRRLVALAAAAGLAVTDADVIDEPVAAGLAWLTHRYLGHGERPTGRLLVFDMGGGTLDIAVLAVEGGPEPAVSVLSCLGVPLAGDALDTAIARDIAAEMAANRIDIGLHPRPGLAWALLERAARETKLRLTHTDEHPILLPRELAYPAPVRYRRAQLEAAFGAQLDGAESLVVSALRAARLTGGGQSLGQVRALRREDLAADVDFVLLAGGMSRIPYVRQRLAALFPHATVYDDAGGAPEETVVAGLAGAHGYERIALHRPGFDLVLEWDGGRHTLYEAFTPLYQPWEVYSGHSELGYERRVLADELPGAGTGLLRVRSTSGRPVALAMDGSTVDGLAVRFGADVVFRAYADGRISIVDAGGPVRVRCAAWPVLTDHAALTLQRW